MDRNKLFGIFTGTHLTILAGIAMAVPGALYGADAFTRVVIQDGGGHQAFITGGKLNVYDAVSDPLLGYSNDPKNLVTFISPFLQSATDGTCVVAYTVPSGKALVIRSLSINIAPKTTGGVAATQLSTVSDCSNAVGGGVTEVTTTLNQSLGTGLVVGAGSSVYFVASGANGSILFYGYLIPASAVPTPSSQPKSQAVAQYGVLGISPSKAR